MLSPWRNQVTPPSILRVYGKKNCINEVDVLLTRMGCGDHVFPKPEAKAAPSPSPGRSKLVTSFDLSSTAKAVLRDVTNVEAKPDEMAVQQERPVAKKKKKNAKKRREVDESAMAAAITESPSFKSIQSRSTNTYRTAAKQRRSQGSSPMSSSNSRETASGDTPPKGAVSRVAKKLADPTAPMFAPKARVRLTERLSQTPERSAPPPAAAAAAEVPEIDEALFQEMSLNAPETEPACAVAVSPAVVATPSPRGTKRRRESSGFKRNVRKSNTPRTDLQMECEMAQLKEHFGELDQCDLFEEKPMKNAWADERVTRVTKVAPGARLSPSQLRRILREHPTIQRDYDAYLASIRGVTEPIPLAEFAASADQFGLEAAFR